MRRTRLARTAALALLVLTLAGCDSDEGSSCGVNEAAIGTVATVNNTVTVDYEGTLADGTVFDGNDCATFALQRTILGFQNNIAGMAVGDTKTFDVPPDQGYGSNPPPGIPPNATLTFAVTLLDIVQ